MFSWQRFTHTLLNDVLAQYKNVLFSSAAAIVIGTIGYCIEFNANPEETPFYVPAFMVALLLGGAVFTSTIYNDIHHPLERYQSLMLPVSSLERFLSRYLLTGPLFYLFIVVLFKVFEVIAALVTEYFFDATAAPLDLQNELVVHINYAFFAGHAILLLGAIFFRNYALPKTVLAMLLLGTLCGALEVISIKIVFWDYFPSFFSFENDRPISFGWGLDENEIPQPVVQGIVGAIYLWILFMAYSCLKDHEV